MIEISLFPTCTIPYNKTIKLDMPAIPGTYIAEIDLGETFLKDKKVEFTKYSFACSGYYEDDYINVFINDIMIEETCYTREILEDENIGNKFIVYSIPNNSKIKVEFINTLGLSNVLWFKLGLLYNI